MFVGISRSPWTSNARNALMKPTMSGAIRKIMSRPYRPKYPVTVDIWEMSASASMAPPAAVIAAWNLKFWYR